MDLMEGLGSSSETRQSVGREAVSRRMDGERTEKQNSGELLLVVGGGGAA